MDVQSVFNKFVHKEEKPLNFYYYLANVPDSLYKLTMTALPAQQHVL